MGLRLEAKLPFVAFVIAAYLAVSNSIPNRNHRIQPDIHEYHRAFRIRTQINEDDESIYKMDLMSWVHGHTVQFGNISETDLKAIINSLKQLIRTESSKFPRIKLYTFRFERDDLEREVLIYTDPEEQKQWIVNIEDLDLRQNLIIFQLGELGFGISRDDTFVVLRKTMSTGDPFHYFHLAYVLPGKKGIKAGYKDVEWDNIKPKDWFPIPVLYKESKRNRGSQCSSRECDLTEMIFGTCPIVKLSCADIKDLPLYGREKDRIDALIREKEPFIYALAKIASINKKYSGEQDEYYRKKRSVETYDDTNENYHSVKRGNIGAVYTGQRSHKRDFVDGSVSIHYEAQPSTLNQDDQIINRESVRAAETPISRPFKRFVRDGEDLVELAETSMDQSDLVKYAANRESFLGDEESRYPSDSETLPSSYDSLMVMEKPSLPSPYIRSSSSFRDEDIEEEEVEETEDEEEMFFENILDKIRKSPTARYTVRPLECVGCEPMGTFFSEFEETSLVAYVANNIVHDIFKNPTRAVFTPEAEEVLEHHSKVPYIGYGSCPYSIRTISQSPKSLELDDLIDYYTETLAVNCEERDCESQRSKTKMRELLTSKYHFLEIWPDMTIRLNKSSVLPKSQLLSTYEFKQFMVSLIFSTYTTEYHLQILSRTDTDLPELDNQDQSVRMKFLSRVILRVMDELIKSYPQHLIKGARYMLQVLEDKYLTLVAEYMGILNFRFNGGENERSNFTTINKSDRLQTLALKDFIINGLASTTKSGAGTFSSFNTFYNRNYERLSNLLVEFGVDRRRRRRRGKVDSRRSTEDYETDLLKKIWTSEAVKSKSEQSLQSKVIDELEEVAQW